MSTDWVVTTAAERIALDEQRRGETTITVTNPHSRSDQAVLEPVPGDGADISWFTVDDPQRTVRPNASVSFLVKAAVPATAAAGTYALQARVYSATSAPEESSVLSNRLLLDIEPAPAAPKPKRWPILVAVAALVVITGVAVTVVATGGKDEKTEATVTPTGSTTPPVPAGNALGKPATQSTSHGSGAAFKAVDGNTDGNFSHGSVTHTLDTPLGNNPWWQVDLTTVSRIDSIRLWNRTDCCGNRLQNSYVFVSDTPFSSDNPQVTAGQTEVWSYYQEVPVAASQTIKVDRNGRYLRVQLVGGDRALSLAEVQLLAS